LKGKLAISFDHFREGGKMKKKKFAEKLFGWIFLIAVFAGFFYGLWEWITNFPPPCLFGS